MSTEKEKNLDRGRNEWPREERLIYKGFREYRNERTIQVPISLNGCSNYRRWSKGEGRINYQQIGFWNDGIVFDIKWNEKSHVYISRMHTEKERKNGQRAKNKMEKKLWKQKKEF